MTTNIEITIDDDDDEVVPIKDNNTILKCTFCSYETKAGDATLKTHILAIHQNPNSKPGAFKSFQCPFCQYSATQKINLHNHIVAIHQKVNKPFKCSSCEFSAVQKAVLDQHMSIKHQTTVKTFPFTSKDFQSIADRKTSANVLGNIHQTGPKLSLFAKQQKVIPAKMPIRPWNVVQVTHNAPLNGNMKYQKPLQPSMMNRNIPYIQNNYTKPKKEKRKMPPRNPNSEATGIMKPMKVSEDLYALVGTYEASRSGCIKELWVYIKKHDLQDPENRRYIIPDEKMAKVFGKEKLHSFTMSKFLGAHLSSKDQEMSRFSDLPLGGEEPKHVKPPGTVLPNGEEKQSNKVNEEINVSDEYIDEVDEGKDERDVISEIDLQQPQDNDANEGGEEDMWAALPLEEETKASEPEIKAPRLEEEPNMYMFADLPLV